MRDERFMIWARSSNEPYRNYCLSEQSSEREVEHNEPRGLVTSAELVRKPPKLVGSRDKRLGTHI